MILNSQLQVSVRAGGDSEFTVTMVTGQCSGLVMILNTQLQTVFRLVVILNSQLQATVQAGDDSEFIVTDKYSGLVMILNSQLQASVQAW